MHITHSRRSHRRHTVARFAASILAAVSLLGAVGASNAAADSEPGKGQPPAAERSAGQGPDAAAEREAPPGRERAAAARSDVQANIRRWVQGNGPKYSFSTHLDSATGRVVLTTDAPHDVRSSVVGKHRDYVDVVEGQTTDLWSRRDDVPSYWGGAGITANGGTCSSGYTVKNASGTRFQVTAGHCWANGTTARTEIGGRTFGTVSGRGLPSKDMELLGGQSYWHYIYVGGTNSSSGMPVVGAGDAYVGYSNYCHSGRTTGENCGHTAQDNFAQVCTSSGCKYPVTAFTGGVQPQPGDSGSPFYVKDSSRVWIRGHVIAGNGTTSYAEKYSRVASHYGVSIVTG